MTEAKAPQPEKAALSDRISQTLAPMIDRFTQGLSIITEENPGLEQQTPASTLQPGSPHRMDEPHGLTVSKEAVALHIAPDAITSDDVSFTESKGSNVLARSSTLFRRQTRASMRVKQFDDIHGQEVADDLRKMIDQVKDYMRAQRRGKQLVLHPERNVFVGRWDVIATLALIYTATLTPFETAFIPPVVGPASWSDPWFWCNRVLDIIFSIDMMLQFFVAYQQAGGSNYGGEAWVDNHRTIVWHYVTGWFFLDSFTAFPPLAFDLYLASDAFSESSDGGIAEKMGVLRVLRTLRLIKLVRLLRASRLVERWRSRINISYGTQTVLKCVAILLCGGHWYACIMGLQASLHLNPLDTWVKHYGLCATTIGPPPLVQPRPSYALPLPGCNGLALSSWYLSALSWSFQIMTGTGGTGHFPSGKSDPETLIITILNVLGAFIWTWVLALFCDVAMNANPGLTAFRQQLDALNFFIRINHLPKARSNDTKATARKDDV